MDINGKTIVLTGATGGIGRAIAEARIINIGSSFGTAMDEPSLVVAEVMRDIRGPAKADKYMGWPEKLFVRINALFPGLVDNSLRKQ
jgi:hypothetical protein